MDKEKINLDVYYIISLLHKDDGITFKQISNLLIENNLSKYLLKHKPNVRRGAIPECKSLPSSIKRYVYDSNSKKFFPLRTYYEDNLELIIIIINSLLKENISSLIEEKLYILLCDIKSNSIWMINEDDKCDKDESKNQLNIDSIETELNKYVKIIDVQDAIKVCKINKDWTIDWFIGKDILKDTSGRVYFIVVNGIIKKIGGSADKGGIKSTINAYKTEKGSPSFSRFGGHELITKELQNDNIVEFYMKISIKTDTMIRGLFSDKIYSISSYKESEEFCVEQYKEQTNTYPEWNFQESGRKWPTWIIEKYNYSKNRKDL